MDTSPEYIKMCEKSGKVQNAWTPKEGDFYFNKRRDEVLVNGSWFRSMASKEALLISKDDFLNAVYLPRQDQLQDMIWKDRSANQMFIATLHLFYNWFMNIPRPAYCESIEQLWLAFVMEKKFGKVWTGEEWQSGHTLDTREDK